MAADEPDPLGSFPAPPEIAVPAEPPAIDQVVPPPPELPASPVPPAATTEPPATISVTEDASGELDVSVRVLSPEEAAPDAAAQSEESVISDDAGTDITAPAVDHAPEVDADAEPAEPAGADVDVSVRVLSPGRDAAAPEPMAGPTSGEEIAATGEPSWSSAPTAPVAGGDDDAPRSAPAAGQYQDVNSQYQSSGNPSPEPWYWSWYLQIDCDGNASSRSEKSGTQSSDEWAWDWRWEWDCGAPERPPPIDELAPEVDERPASGEPAGQSPQTTAPTETADAPWLWTWTFTFCGETATAVLPIEVQVPFEWAWDWTWTWTCDEAGGDAPSLPTLPAPEATAPAPTASSPGGSQSSFEPLPAAGSDAETGAAALPSLPAISLTVPVISPASLLLPWLDLPWLDDLALVGPSVAAVEAGAGPAFAAAVPPPPLPAVLPAPPVVTVSVTVVVPVSIPSSPAPQIERVGTSRPAPQARPHPHPARARSHVLGPCCVAVPEVTPAAQTPTEARPVPRRAPAPGAKEDGRRPLAPTAPVQTSGLGGASSSVVPGGVVAGTAALIALLLLSAPGLGRRIRVARALRPRGTIGSSIDRPG